MGELKDFLGIHITKLEDNRLKLDKTDKIITSLKRFGFENLKRKGIPIEYN